MSTIQQYKCPSCGAPLVFSGEKQALHCSSCGNDFSAETVEQFDEATAQSNEPSKFDWEHYEPRNFDNDKEIELGNYTCKSCGAQVIGEVTDGALKCLYCDNVIIIEDQFDGGLKPDFIIPFKIEKKDAMNLFKNSCKDKKLLPKGFMDESRLKEIKGLYVPFWTADCDCDANITYNATKVRTWRSGNYRYTKTDHFSLYRSGNISFERIPADASSTADDAYMDAIEPYDYNEAVDFNTGYLSGYMASRYDVSFDDCIKRINTRIKQTTENKFASTAVGYNSVSTNHSAVNCKHGKLRYALMPVWVLNIRYKDEIYKFAMNGQTGKMVGNYPISIGRTVLYFLKNLLLSTVIFGVIGILLAKGGIV